MPKLKKGTSRRQYSAEMKTKAVQILRGRHPAESVWRLA